MVNNQNFPNPVKEQLTIALGPAVYSARAFLMGYSPKQYVNACELYTTPPKPSLRLKKIVDNQDKELKEVQVYPNPTQGQLNVILSLEKADQGLLQIMDLQGRMVTEKVISDGINSIDLQPLGSSLYFYTIRKNGRVIKSDKLIIQ